MKSENSIESLCKAIEKDLPRLVSAKRLRHIYAVRDLATELAVLFARLGADISPETAKCAALLHDITKCMNQRELCEKYGIKLSADDERSPETLHAITGARYAADRYGSYGIPDCILSAVERHTVGAVDMSLLDSIIFVADYCEETRQHKECIETRKRLFELLCGTADDEVNTEAGGHLSATLAALELIKLEILGKTMKYLAENGDFIHIQSVLTFESILEKNMSGNKSSSKIRNEISAAGAEYMRYARIRRDKE